ncbi:MAG: class I SAM-dependent methyltransferase [Candidatus Diapherotrites archaeon]|nr:class I SAM-dependent methyltransferase [Candidatus Diapherotrites archaeon]
MDRIEFLLSAAKGRVLDIGFNPHYKKLHEGIAEKAGKKNVIGIDIVVEGFEPNIAKASAEKMPFRKECFDSIIAGEIIEHLKGPGAFVKECSRVLKKGGLLALSTPNKKSWVNRLFHSYEAPLHFSLFSLGELEALLEKNSFRVVSVKMFPYTAESSEGSQHKWFMPFRKAVHFLMPDSLRENMCIIAEKQ